MSITNSLFPNEIDLRARKSIFEEVWTIDPSSGEYAKLLPGGGGGGPAELPYYLKGNSVKIDSSGGGTNTLIDENSVDVNDLTGVKSSSLVSDGLILGDSVDNAKLLKADIVAAGKLSSALAGAIGTTTADTQSLLIQNSATGAISRSSTVRLSNTAGQLNYITLDPGQVYLNNNSGAYSTLGSGNLGFNATGYLSKLYSDRMFTMGTSSLVFAQIQPSQIRIGVSTSSSSPVVDTTRTYATLVRDGLNLYDGTNTYSLLVGDVKTTNKLRALNSTTPGTNSKMLIYDPTTTAFNYANIPLKDITSATSGVNSKMLIYDTGTAAFNYTDIPSGGGGTTGSVKKLVLTSNGGHFIAVQNDDWSASSGFLKRMVMGAGDTVYIDSSGGDYIYYNKWYGLFITEPGVNNWLVDMKIVEGIVPKKEADTATGELVNDYQRYTKADVMWFNYKEAANVTKNYYPGMLFFRVSRTRYDATYTHFKGVIKLKMLSLDTTAIPTTTLTPV